jgi:hypothetical protein
MHDHLGFYYIFTAQFVSYKKMYCEQFHEIWGFFNGYT